VFAELLRKCLGGGANLSSEQADLMRQHYELLVRWNRVLNLTAVREMAEIVERHYCESVFLANHLPSGSLAIADIGSGAGFPGVPLAICRPDCLVTLIESHQRKAVFLREATRTLPNVRVAAKRAEDVQERFDWAVSRAVKPSDIVLSLQRLAPNVALLAGDAVGAELPQFRWEPPVHLPWGRQRYLWMGCSI